jgi:putative membrane protein
MADGLIALAHGMDPIRNAVMAGMMNDNDHMDSDWWWVMGLGWLIFLALIGLLVYMLVRHHTGGGPDNTAGVARRSGEDVLAERFARGEIDAEEYRHRLDILRQNN